MQSTLGYPWKTFRNYIWYKMQHCKQFWGSHVTPLLRKLHWLPICFWIQFNLGPGYLRNHLTPMRLVYLLVAAEGACCRPCQLRGSDCGVQETSLFCHDSCPLEQCAPRGENCLHPRLLKEPENLSLSSGLGCPIMEVTCRLDKIPSPPCLGIGSFI